jgi:hypothetical protein
LADWITITGVKPYDGRYELDLRDRPLTTREWGWIKKHAGYLPLTLETDSFTDPEFVIVQAVIAVHRAGRVDAADVPNLVERFQDVDPFAAITYEAGTDETEDGDAAGPPQPSSDMRRSTNGDSSITGSGSLDDPLKPTGHPASDISVSDPAMSAT